MKLAILPFLVLSALLISSYNFGQKNTAFAVTASVKGNYMWGAIREIDLSTGEVIRTLYDPANNTPVNLRAVAGKNLRSAAVIGTPTGVGVAAAAFDAEHNRLYFTNMRSNDLMYFDLTAADLNVVVDDNPLFNTGDKLNEANVVTRMAFTSNGFGYAATNDGKNFLQFTTGSKPTVRNLGELIDGPKNGSISIHTQASSWGGDMVGDAYGNLYLISYRNHVFKINPNTRVADYLGQIKGLSADFTTNGVAVDNDGNVIVTSAVITDNYYKVDISSLEAKAFKKREDKLYNCSDLANGNLLFQNKSSIVKSVSLVKKDKSISVFPNPIVANESFTIKFEKLALGKYQLALVDAAGSNVLSRPLNINVAGQVERLNLPNAAAGGVFMIKVIGSNRKVAYQEKLVVQ